MGAAAQAKVMVCAPADATGESHRRLQALGLMKLARRGEVPDSVYNQAVIPRWRSRFGGKSVWG